MAGRSPVPDQEQQQSTDAVPDLGRDCHPAKGNKLMQRLSSLWKRALCRGTGSVVVDEDDYHDEDDYIIDGPAVDVYSAGVVLYEMVSFSLLQHTVLHLAVIYCCIE